MNSKLLSTFLKAKPYQGQSLITPYVVILLFLLAALVYSLYGFYGPLVQDDSFYLYCGQRIAAGVPPYVGVFQGTTPIASMLMGFGVMLAEMMGWNDIITVRVVFFFISCLTVVVVYLLAAYLFNSMRTGVFSAMTFIAFHGFALHAASGPRAKTPMLLFEILNLLFTAKKLWFWAGFFGSLSFLVWQPAGIYPLITFIIAVSQPKGQKYQAVSQTLLGIIFPMVLIGGYFAYHHALPDLLEGSLLFHLSVQLDRSLLYETSFLSRLTRPLGSVGFGYRSMMLPIFIGLVMISLFYLWRRTYNKNWSSTLTTDPFSVILLTFPAIIIWSVIDFQNYPDFYIFLPYAALGFGQFIVLAIQRLEAEMNEFQSIIKYSSMFLLATTLLGVSLYNAVTYNKKNNGALHRQIQFARQLEERFEKESGTRMKLLSINDTKVLVFLKRVNPTRYVLINGGGDHEYIHATTPGGFEGWLRSFDEYDPDVIVLGWTWGWGNLSKLRHWLKTKYTKEKIEGMEEVGVVVYVKKGQSSPSSGSD
ncbi:MAG: hypothetical protein B6242_12705 [Anaerolineaceae bacterium 4572_78]|nr:MAG: hypothetical protein B6242_12705 [Anaerolineaceae bacterium 4572_78]